MTRIQIKNYLPRSFGGLNRWCNARNKDRLAWLKTENKILSTELKRLRSLNPEVVPNEVRDEQNTFCACGCGRKLSPNQVRNGRQFFGHQCANIQTNKNNTMKKTLLIITLGLLSFATPRAGAQSYTTAGQVLTIAATPNTNSFCTVSNADGTVTKYFADRYNFWAGRAPGTGSLFDTQPVPTTGTNDIVSLPYIQPWNSTNFYWVTATCSANNSNSGPSVATNFVVPIAPIVFVLPPQPPQYVRVVPVK